MQRIEEKYLIYLNTIDNEGESLLHNAVLYREYEDVKILVERGAIVNMMNLYDETPLEKLQEPCPSIVYEINPDLVQSRELRIKVYLETVIQKR